MDPACTYPGGSILIDYKGNVLSEASSSDEGLLEQTFSLESLRRFREKFPAWMDADPFDIL
jgi:predicted amidohydrolase